MLAMGAPDALSSSPLRSSVSLSGFGPVLYTAFSSPSAFISSLNHFQTLDPNGSVNWGKIVFLTTCFAAMAGCGLLSALLRQKSTKRLSRFRRSARKDYSKNASETMTSSEEDEDYDSNGSLRHGTEGAHEKEAAPHHREESADALTTDPGLLRKHSSYLSYSTSVATYPSIRTFFCPHPQMSKFPSKPSPVPLLVFVHGLGGSLAQFNHILASLSNIGPCFGIDLPGCGRSEFAPTSWDAYTVDAMAELLVIAIEKHRDREAGQGVILIAHSLGCSLSALLASSNSSVGVRLKDHVLGLIAVCPRAAPPSPHETTLFRRLLYIPGPLFDLWRRWDRRGGADSASVARFVGSDADIDTKELQVRYNKQSKTAVWRRMAWGTLPEYTNNKTAGGMPGEQVWAGIQTPVLLVAGESDAITKPEEIQKILKFFGDIKAKANPKVEITGSSIIPDASSVHDQLSAPHDHLAHEEEYGIEPQNTEKDLKNDGQYSVKPSHPIKTAILPAPASHALLYDRATYRTLSGIIQDFLCHHVDHRLSLGWQLQYLNTSGKWDVKNLAKWQKVAPMSEPLANTFAAMKMLREVDDEHNPVLFSQKNRDQVYAVIDISHESPVYNPASLEKGGIHYYKHPTVSKIPPTPDETRDFIALVDRLQDEISQKVEKRGDSTLPRPLVGVHCHYGFNRTGFLIACYLIERRGFSVQGAIDEFERRRPPGIRHGHFVDTLFVRYCLGLKRAPTL